MSGIFIQIICQLYEQLRIGKIVIKQEDQSIQNNLSLSDVSLAFHIQLICLPISISTLFIEIIHLMLKIVTSKFTLK